MKEYKYHTVCSIIAIIFIIAAIGFSLYAMVDQLSNTPNLPTFIIINSSIIISSLIGFIYLVKGASKADAIWLKLFILVQGVCHLASILRTSFISSSNITPLFDAIIFGILCILIFAKDLGKTKSYLLCILLIVLDVTITLLLNISNFKIGTLVNTLSMTTLDFILILLIKHKYFDKAQRGTK